jgi:hypothetical protein
MKQIGRTPGATPLEIPACWLWSVQLTAPVNDWDLLIREIHQNEIPGLWLGQYAVDSDLKQLAGLAELRSLNLWNGKITDTGLEHMKGMTSLQDLWLGYTKITDKGIEYLKDLTGLQSLNLLNTRVTDAGLEYLKDMTQLRSLSVTGTQITDAGIQQLKQSLPNVTISK